MHFTAPLAAVCSFLALLGGVAAAAGSGNYRLDVPGGGTLTMSADGTICGRGIDSFSIASVKKPSEKVMFIECIGPNPNLITFDESGTCMTHPGVGGNCAFPDCVYTAAATRAGRCLESKHKDNPRFSEGVYSDQVTKAADAAIKVTVKAGTEPKVIPFAGNWKAI